MRGGGLIVPQEAFQGRQYGKRESLKKLSDELNTKEEMQLQHACKHSSVAGLADNKTMLW